MLIKCPECGHQVSDQAKTCPECGIEIAGKITRCPDCGEIIFKEQAACPNCHCVINGASAPVATPVENTTTEADKKSAATAAKKPAPQPAPRRPRRRKAGVTALIIAFVLALIVVFLGIYFMKNQEQKNEQRAYENAMLSTEPLVLQNFLDMYVDAPRQHRDSIKTHLTALKKVETDWTNAMVNNSKYAFEHFMKRYPQSTHNVEAAIKIDSLDWEAAVKENTAEAFKRYFTEHEDGAHYDEAHANYEQIEAQKVTAEDKIAVSQLFSTFFNALAQRDEVALSASLAPVLSSFLHRQNATKDDVKQYMDKLHEPDITRMEFILADDWKIDKQEVSEGRYDYIVDFSVAQRLERTNEERETSVHYKITAKVSADNYITELNMKRSVQ